MAKLYDRQVLLAKVESVYGQDATPAAASDAIPIVDKAKIEFDVDKKERKNPLASRGKIKPLIGKMATKITFKTELCGSGTAITPPRTGALLKMCGFAETIGASDVTYKPESVPSSSGTLYTYLDGLLYKTLGSVGNFKMSGKSGEAVEMDWDFLGLYQDDSDASIVSPTFESNHKTPPQMLSVSFTLGGITTFVLREFNIDAGIPIIKRADVTAATGYAGFLCGKTNPAGSLTIEAPAKSVYDFLDKLEKATEVAASIVIGATAGNIWTITLPSISFENIKVSEGDNLVLLELPISINVVSANGNDITLKHS